MIHNIKNIYDVFKYNLPIKILKTQIHYSFDIFCRKYLINVGTNHQNKLVSDPVSRKLISTKWYCNCPTWKGGRLLPSVSKYLLNPDHVFCPIYEDSFHIIFSWNLGKDGRASDTRELRLETLDNQHSVVGEEECYHTYLKAALRCSMNYKLRLSGQLNSTENALFRWCTA